MSRQVVCSEEKVFFSPDVNRTTGKPRLDYTRFVKLVKPASTIAEPLVHDTAHVF